MFLWHKWYIIVGCILKYFMRWYSKVEVNIHCKLSVRHWPDTVYILPFVPGCRCQCLCLIDGCTFGSQELWTSALGSFWTVLLDQPGPHPEGGQPGRDHCCDGHGEACLWRGKWSTKRVERKLKRKRESGGMRKKGHSKEKRVTATSTTFSPPVFQQRHISGTRTVPPRMHDTTTKTWKVLITV